MSKRAGTPPVFLFLFLLLFCSLGVLASCSPRVIEHTHTEYVVSTLVKRDTVSTKDSVYIREWMKGDTVYIEKFKDRYYYRDRWRDSIQVKEVHDTTQVRVEVPVEKKLSVMQSMKIKLFPWVLLAAIAFGLWTFRKRLFGLL